LAFAFANFRRPESLSSLLLLPLLLYPSSELLSSDPSELLPRFFLSELLSSDPSELLPRFFPSELLSSDPSELLPRFFLSELAAPESLARLPRDTSLGLAVAKLSKTVHSTFGY
jgi:hypothetical protein